MPEPRTPAVSDADEQVYEKALERLGAFGSELRNGFTNHAPMVAEALVVLAHPESVEAWLDGYLLAAQKRRSAARPVPAEAWEAYLGRTDSEAAWALRFAADIAADGWRPALTVWCERLAPGFAAAAAHGVIRTAHAARALSRAESPLRREELAAGLALWASNWQVLPGSSLAQAGTLDAAAALRRVPLVDAGRRRNDGAITTALTVLDDEPGFRSAVQMLDRDRPTAALALDLATTFAGLFVDQVRSALQAIVYTHAITGVAAALRLAPWVGDRVAGTLLAHAWQTGAALHACYASEAPVPVEESVAATGDLILAAVEHGDEHVIKLADACREFHRASGDPRFPAALACALAAIPAGA